MPGKGVIDGTGDLGSAEREQATVGGYGGRRTGADPDRGPPPTDGNYQVVTLFSLW